MSGGFRFSSGALNRREFLLGGSAVLAMAGLTAVGATRGPCKLRFGVVSDIHLAMDCPWESGRKEEPLREAALEGLFRWYDAQGVDAVLVPGDIADFGKAAELEIVRRDFKNGEDVDAAWIMPHPARAGGPFDPKRRPSLFPLPEFAAGSALTVKPDKVHLRSGAVGPGWRVTAPGAAKTTGGRLMAYEVGYRRKGKYMHLFYAAAMDYNQPPSRLKDTASFSISGLRLPQDAEEIVVKPLDCFGRAGTPLTVTMTSSALANGLDGCTGEIAFEKVIF